MANQDEQKDYIVQMVKIDKDATQHKVYPITRDTNVKVIPANNVPSTVTNLHELVENFGNAAFTNINQATSAGAGLMAAADKAKLDAIEAGAQVNTITGVKGGAETEYRTGNVNITKDNIGLSNVENKSSATIRGELTQVNVTTALGYTPPKTDTTYTTATQTNNGLMSSKDKAKLDGVQSGAQVNTLTGVKGDAESSYRIGNVNITKANVGLGNVENKSSATIRGELTKTDVTTALGYTPPTTNTTYADATTTVHGLMSTDDKTKLDAIEAGAQVNTVTGIKGGAETEYRTGNVNITKDNIGLSNVENKSSAAIRGEMTKTDVTTALGYTPPTTDTTYGIATAKTAGLVKSGSGITVDTSGNVSINNNSHTHTIANVTGLQSALDSKLNTSLKGAASGLAELDNNGKVPSSQLPSYVDDVIDVAMASDLASATDKSGATIKPETGKIYIDDIGDNASNKTYRWSGTTYVVISETLALGETSSTAFDGARGKVAYTHSQSAHARVDATKTEKSSTNGNIKINGTETNVYTHPSYTAHDSGLYKIANDASGHVNSVTAVTKADITGLGIPGQDTTYSDVTTSTHGLMTAADKAKLNGIATGANAYVHPTYASHTSGFYKIANDSTGHVSGATAVTKADITALGIPGQDTTYVDMKGSTTDANGTHGLVPAPEKGASNRYLRSDGGWVVPPDTTYNDATTSAHGLMTAAMVTKLNSIATGANAYTHPTHTAYTSGLYKITVDNLGHVTAATAVAKSDITALGIPGQDTNTTYSVATSTTPGLVKSGGNVTVNSDGTMSVAYASSAGSASAVTWANISGKPSTYTPTSHTHAVSEITNLQTTINTINSSIATKSAIGHTHDSIDITNISDVDLNTLKDTTFKVYYAGGTNTVANKPSGVDAFGMLSYRIASGYNAQELYSSNVNSGKYIRYYDPTGDTWTAWEKVYTSTNKPSKSDVGLSNVDNTADANKSVKYATTAGSANSVAWANVSGKPSTYYTHPSYTSHANGLYKVTVDGSGHVSAVSNVTKADITALGIPGQDTNTTYSTMGAATSSAAGSSGLVPAPTAGASNRYLRSDGTWAVPPDTNTTYNDATTSAHGLMTAAMVTKLNSITSGANAYTHPSYTAHAAGLYKVTVDGSGHVSAVSNVTKADITSLGIPGQDTNTTYGIATSTTAGLGLNLEINWECNR